MSPIVLAVTIIVLANARITDELLSLARSAVRAEVLGKPAPVNRERTAVLPVFVTIERGGKVLGCRGELEPASASLEEEVVRMARAAARHDPRYKPLAAAQLPGLKVTVTVVERLEPIATVDGLGPEDGLVLESGSKRGVVLPWEGKDPKVRLSWAFRKAGVSPSAPHRLLRMVAERRRG